MNTLSAPAGPTPIREGIQFFPAFYSQHAGLNQFMSASYAEQELRLNADSICDQPLLTITMLGGVALQRQRRHQGVDRESSMAYQRIWNQRVFYEILKRFTVGKRWLDVGCGRNTDLRGSELKGVREHFQEHFYVGTDLNMDSLRENASQVKLCADASRLPFFDKSFDVISSNMMFEHLSNPVAALQEMNRTLRDDGVILVHCASSLHGILICGRLISKFLPERTYERLVAKYTGRKLKDIFPTQYRANTASRFANSAAAAGLHPVLLSYLDTPRFFPPPLRWFESAFESYLPGCFKGTLLAICLKNLN